MMKRILLLIMLVLVAPSCLEKKEMADQVKIYYIPIGVETYIPITVENIETFYHRYGEVDLDNRKFKKFLRMINEAAPGNFDGYIIRAKIIFPDDQIIYIDNDGGISFITPDTRKLTSSRLKKAGKILEDLTDPKPLSKLGR